MIILYKLDKAIKKLVLENEIVIRKCALRRIRSHNVLDHCAENIIVVVVGIEVASAFGIRGSSGCYDDIAQPIRTVDTHG